MIEFSFIQVAHFYVAMLLCFSICLLFVAGKLNRRPALIWIFSNFFASVAMELFAIGEIGFGIEFRPTVFVLQCLAPLLKFLSLAHGWKWKKIKNIILFGIVASFILPLIALQLSRDHVQPFIFNIGSTFFAFACLYPIIYNRYWKGILGRAAMMINFSLAGAGIFLRALKSWEQGTLFFLLDPKEELIPVLFFLAIIGFIGQMAFLLMLTSRTQYYAQIKQRREERVRTRSISLRLQNKEISRLLDEQRRLLETLTHEVRQPINNAQAALQGIMSDLQPTRGDQRRALPVAIRIQGILDEITLSLTNAIVGATLVERGEGAELRECEITGIAQLALLDCPESVRERIVVDFPATDIFLASDPILLRLALRNMLDNAAKFSPPGTEIVFSISLDEARFGILIAVSNFVESSFVFEPHMLERGKRGPNTAAKDGSGIGLYVINEIARIHGQNMVVDEEEPGKVTFGLLLSE